MRVSAGAGSTVEAVFGVTQQPAAKTSRRMVLRIVDSILQGNAKTQMVAPRFAGFCSSGTSGAKLAMEAALAHHNGNVLLAVYREGNRARARHVIQAGAPDFLAVGTVVGMKYAIDGADKGKSSGGREYTGCEGCALTHRPQHFSRCEIQCLQSSVLSIAVWARPDAPVHA